MDYLTVGSYPIPYTWLAFLGTILFFEIKYRKKDDATIRTLENGVWVYLIVWKFSYIPLFFSNFIQAPLSALYFDGGLWGHGLAIMSLFIYLYFKRRLWSTKEVVYNWLLFISIFQSIELFASGQYIIAIAFLGLLAITTFAFKEEVIYLQLLLLVYVTSWMDPFVWVTFLFSTVYIVTSKNYKQIAYVALVPFIVITLSNFQLEKEELVGAINEIKLETSSGDMYSLQQQDEEIIIVNFFATWCPPCKAEMPHLQSFAQDLPGNVQLIGVNLSARDKGAEALEKFMLKYKVNYPILVDKDDTYGKKLNIRSIPTTIILKNGEEVKRIVGPVSESMLEQLVLNIVD